MRFDPKGRRRDPRGRAARLVAAMGFAALLMLASACSGSGSGGSSPGASSPAPTGASAGASASSTAAALSFSMRDPKGGFIVRYPASWSEHDDSGGGISLRAPQRVGLAGIHYEATGQSLEQVAKRAPGVEKGTISNFDLVDTNPAKIGGEKAVQFTYTGRNSSKVDLKAFAAWTVGNGRAYRFSFVASADYYDELYPTAQAIMHSVQFRSR